MKAGYFFINEVKNKYDINKVQKIKIDLYGSLALTKSGHGTDIALMLGLCGYTPKDVEPNDIDKIIDNIRKTKKIKLNFEKDISFDEDVDILHSSNNSFLVKRSKNIALEMVINIGLWIDESGRKEILK